jgi:hypothetical protein
MCRKPFPSAVWLALALLLFPGCGLVGTTIQATKFVAKSTVAVGKAGVKVVTWPVRAIRNRGSRSKADALAQRHSVASGPEPIVAGHVSSDGGVKTVTNVPRTPEDGPRVIANEADDGVRLR